MTPQFVAFDIAFAIAWVATPVVRAAALRAGLVDVPNARSSHTVPTPRLGGLAIVLAVGVSVAAILPADAALVYILMAAAALAVTGAIDDIRALPRSVRLIVQLGAAVLVMRGAGLVIPADDLPATVSAIGAGAAVVTVLWLVWLTNAYNFMDGINGLAGCQAVIASATLALLAVRRGDPTAATALLAISGASLGFLPWNFPRASIFMGDAGSATLGFAFAALAVRISGASGSFVAAMLPFAPFLLDASVTLAMRIWRRERFLEPHRSHFYQRAARLGNSHKFATVIWSGLAVISAAAALTYDSVSPAGRASLLTGVIVIHVAVAALVVRAEKQRATTGRPVRQA